MNDREHRIRLRAYEIWEREGRHEGRADDHWRQAQIEIERESVKAAQTIAPEQPTKKSGKRAEPSTDKAKARSGASGSNGKTGKPAASRGKKPAESRSHASAPA